MSDIKVEAKLHKAMVECARNEGVSVDELYDRAVRELIAKHS